MSVICCAHNEEEYVGRSVPNLLKALEDFSSEIIFVADRCTDSTVEKVRKYQVRVIEKKWKKWKNGYAESLQTGLLYAKGAYIAIVDADIIVPANFFRVVMPIVKGDLASVAAHLVTYPDTLWNRLVYAWEKTYSLAPLGRGRRGAARIILKKALDEINGFRDVFTTDTDMDIRLAKRGYKSVTTSALRGYHMRHISLKSVVNGQIRMGRGRYMIGYGFMRTMGHALFRFRPFVVGGWLMEWIRKSN
jgi:glycosyltransferase involved in cell wall biosynthesis